MDYGYGSAVCLFAYKKADPENGVGPTNVGKKAKGYFSEILLTVSRFLALTKSA